MEGVDSLLVTNILDCVISNRNTVDSLHSQIDALQSKTDMLSGIIEASNSSVSNQLTVAGILLALVGLIVTVFGAVIGLYISKKKAEIEKLAQTVEEKKTIVASLAKTTKELDDQIHNDLKGLYQQLRKEETNALLDRLVLEPRDILNLTQLLFARDLEDSGFVKLREAYLKLKASLNENRNEEEESEESSDDLGGFSRGFEETGEDKYTLLFFQHYCGLSLMDEDIRPELIKSFGDNFDCAFKRDMIKSTIDICQALSDKNSTFNKEDVLVSFLKALNESKHSNLTELKNILEQNIQPDSLLKKAVERCTKEGVYLKIMGVEKPNDEEKKG